MYFTFDFQGKNCLISGIDGRIDIEQKGCDTIAFTAAQIIWFIHHFKY